MSNENNYPPFDRHIASVKAQLWKLHWEAWEHPEKMKAVSQAWSILAELVQTRSSHLLNEAEMVIRQARSLN